VEAQTWLFILISSSALSLFICHWKQCDASSTLSCDEKNLVTKRGNNKGCRFAFLNCQISQFWHFKNNCSSFILVWQNISKTYNTGFPPYLLLKKERYNNKPANTEFNGDIKKGDRFLKKNCVAINSRWFTNIEGGLYSWFFWPLLFGSVNPGSNIAFGTGRLKGK